MYPFALHVSPIPPRLTDDLPLSLHGAVGNMNVDQPWITVQDAVGGVQNESMPPHGGVPLDHFSSTCFYFGAALRDGLDDKTLPIGLIHTAWGGSMIEEWLTGAEVAACRGADIADHNSLLWNTNVLPYLDMSVKGWVWYRKSDATPLPVAMRARTDGR